MAEQNNRGYTDAKGFVDMLDEKPRSEGYKIIRDEMSQDMLTKIKGDTQLYKRFQDIKIECKKSDEYDRKVPTMLDVNRGLTNLYGIILRLIGAQKNDNDATLSKVCTAINKIEERLGIEQTDWEDSKDVTVGTVNGKGITPDSDRTE